MFKKALRKLISGICRPCKPIDCQLLVLRNFTTEQIQLTESVSRCTQLVGSILQQYHSFPGVLRYVAADIVIPIVGIYIKKDLCCTEYFIDRTERVFWVSNLISANAGGMDLLEIAQVYQRSGLVLVYKK